VSSNPIPDVTGRHRPALEDLGAAVLDSPGALEPDVRRAAADRGAVPEPFADYVGKIHAHAYRITDRVVEELKAAGASEDAIFEMSVAAAYGAARYRLEAGLAALRAATGEH
jgi:hypothetical protein